MFQRQDHEMHQLQFSGKQWGTFCWRFFRDTFCLVWSAQTSCCWRLGGQLTSWPGRPVFMIYSKTGGDICDLGEDQKVCRCWVKQVTIYRVQRAFEEKVPAWYFITARLPPAQRGTAKPPAPSLSDLTMKKGLGVPPKRLHLGTPRVPPSHCSCAEPPPVTPQLLLITKALPSICYHCGFCGHFWTNSCASLV